MAWADQNDNLRCLARPVRDSMDRLLEPPPDILACSGVVCVQGVCVTRKSRCKSELLIGGEVGENERNSPDRETRQEVTPGLGEPGLVRGRDPS